MPTHSYKNPESYSRNNELQYQFAQELIKDAEIKPTDRVLDLGCGDGRIDFELATLALTVIGTDVSEKMTEHAARTYAQQPNLGFMQMDAASNKFRNQFDVITSFNCLHWVKNQTAALQGIYDAAVEDARIILLLSHRKSTYHFALDNTCANPKWINYFKNYKNPRSFFTKEEYSALLRSVKLKTTSLQEKEMTYTFETEEQFKGFLKSSMANIKEIPDHLKEEFLTDYIAEFKNLLGNHYGDRGIAVSFWCLQVIANKPRLQNEETFTFRPGLKARL